MDKKIVIYNNKELEKWKFKLMTLSKPEEKLSFFREIFEKEILIEEKAFLFLEALGNNNKDIQEIALSGLSYIGLSKRLTFSLKEISNNFNYVSEILEIIDGLKEIDLICVLFIAIQNIKKNVEERIGLLKLVLEIIKKEFINKSIFYEIIRAIMDTPFSSKNQSKEYEIIKEIFFIISDKTPDFIYEIMWEEVKIRKLGIRKILALKTIAHIKVKEENLEEFIDIITGEELNLYLKNPTGTYSLEQELKNYIDYSIKKLCDILIESKDKLAILDLIEKVLGKSNLPDTKIEYVIENILKAIKKTGVAGMQKLMWNNMFKKVSFSTKWRKIFAEQIILLFNYKSVPEFYEELIDSLKRLGPVTIEVIIQHLFNNFYSYSYEENTYRFIIALEKLTTYFPQKVLENKKIPQLIKEKSIKALKKILSMKLDINQQIFIGEFCIFFSKILTKFPDENTLEAFGNILIENVFEISNSNGIIKSIGNVICNKIDFPIKNRLIEILFELFSINWNSETLIFENDKESEEIKKHINWLPEILYYMGELLFFLPEESDFREKIIFNIENKWKKIINWEEIWSPSNFNNLLIAMSKISNAPYVSLEKKNNILQILVENFEKFPPEIITQNIFNIIKTIKISDKLKIISNVIVEKILISLKEEKDEETLIKGRYELLTLIKLRKLINKLLSEKIDFVITKACNEGNEEALKCQNIMKKF